MASAPDRSSVPGGGPVLPEDPDIDDLIAHLENLKESVDAPEERTTVGQVIDLVERMPGSRAFTHRVRNYTTRDIAEGFVGGIIFALPLLVEDGVFLIAEWFVSERVGGLPVVLVLNGIVTVGMIIGLLYYTDWRDVQVTKPIFGLVPRRLVGLLLSSFLVALGLMLLWGRLHEGEPTTVEAFARVCVVWTAAAIGATLGDILPGESQGEDINDILADFADGDTGGTR